MFWIVGRKNKCIEKAILKIKKKKIPISNKVLNDVQCVINNCY